MAQEPTTAEAAPVTDVRALAIKEAWDAAQHSWWVTHIHNSPISRDTPALNHLNASMDALRDAVLEAMSKA